MNETMKGLPANELTIAAICIVLGFDPNAGENGDVETEMDILDQKLWDTFKPANKPNRCACCGHVLKYACAIVHEPTGNGFWVGRDCAYKVDRLRRFDAEIAKHTVAMAERLACDKREAGFLVAHPEAMSVVAWCKSPRAPKIARNMLEKMRRFGALSEKQVQTLESIRTKDEERRRTATETVKAERRTIRGIVRKAEMKPGFRNDELTLKLLVDLGTGVRLYGNAPEWMTVTEITLAAVLKEKSWMKVGAHAHSYEVIGVGDTVEFTATVEPSKDDNLFGFWKRPSNFTIIAKAPPAPVPASVAPSQKSLLDEFIRLQDEAKTKGLEGDEAAAYVRDQLAVFASP